MREIKFRCFYQLTKRMEYLHNCTWSGGSLPNIMYWENGKCSIMEWIGGVSRETDSAIIMQYTGLKDKNGVEIYEGDIIRCFTDDGELNGIVNYRHGSYYFGDYFLHNPYFDTVEVMANVYEGIKIK